MGRSAIRRLSNYTYGLQPERVRETLTAKKPEMVAKETEIFGRQVQVEELVIGVLASEDAVTTISYPNYQAFAREIEAKQKNFPGGAGLNNEAAVLLAKWKARGLTEAVSIRIRNEVFSIPAPGAPPPGP